MVDFGNEVLINQQDDWFARMLRKLGPVSQKSRNFSGLSRVPQFPLYLRNAGVLSHQTSPFSCFSFIEIMLKDQLFEPSRFKFDNWLLARKVLGTFNRLLARVSDVNT